jgi:protein-S-isoprenylcysteine O-methyltransferase Ste14
MNISVGMLVVQIVGMFAVFALALFVPAGTLSWPAGWVFLGLFFGFTIALSAWLLRHDPGLLRERMAGFQSSQKLWDKIFLLVISIVFLAWLVLMPLDAVRFHSSYVPVWLQVVGAILLLISFYLFFLVYRENSFLSPVIRIQEDRGQTVISTGPYRYVRHPMYSAFILMAVGTPLLLGSWYGLILGLVLVLTVTGRLLGEERMLCEDLPGYREYTTRTRHRLIPHIW